MRSSAFRLVLAASLIVPTAALAEAGRVLMAVGEVFATRAGQDVPLTTGALVEPGDTIRVGPSSNVQVRLTDESIFALRERTTFRIDEYQYAPGSEGRSFFSLLAGGLRTVTGAIGRLQKKENYGVRTATSTIGIRGTHYTLRECAGDCTAAGGSAAPNGTYGGVSDGRIGVTNEAADLEFGKDQYFYVADRNTPPQGLVAPPPFLHDRLEGQARTQGQQGRESGETLAQSGINAESRPSEVPAAPEPSAFVATEQKTTTGTSAVVPTAAEIGLLGGWVSADGSSGAGGALVPKSALTLDASSRLVTFSVPAGCVGPNEECRAGVSGSFGSSVDMVGQGSSVDIRWGRWLSGTVTEDVGTVTISPSMGGVHALYGPLAPPDVMAAKTGILTWFDAGLGTTPTNNLGQIAASANFPTVELNFTTRTGSTTNGMNWNFTGASPQNWSVPAGQALTVTIVSGQGAYLMESNVNNTAAACSGAGCAGASGKFGFRGIFMGTAGDHLGTSISVRAGTGSTPSSAHAVRVYNCSPHC